MITVAFCFLYNVCSTVIIIIFIFQNHIYERQTKRQETENAKLLDKITSAETVGKDLNNTIKSLEMKIYDLESKVSVFKNLHFTILTAAISIDVKLQPPMDYQHCKLAKLFLLIVSYRHNFTVL